VGLVDPRAVDILTAEHWSLLSTRALGYQEMFGRTTVFVATLSTAAVALAVVAQATRFGRKRRGRTLWRRAVPRPPPWRRGLASVGRAPCAVRGSLSAEAFSGLML
jgi:hypothetical protein